MIGSSENRISYNGNGIATEFAYTFKILEKSDMKVLHVAIDGTETLLVSDYYVDMEKSVVLYPGYSPGAEIPEQNRPPILPVGERLVLYREVPITQESALDKHWPFNVIENGLDKLTIICQQIWDRLQRSFYVSESTSTNFDPKVPIEAGKTFRVKDDGTGFEVTEDPGKVIDGATALLKQTTEQAESANEAATNAQNAANEVREIYGDGNFTPLSDLLGGLGTKLKRWGAIFANKVFASNLPIVYNSVAEMKADTMLWEGMNTKTLGYYTPNDGGCASYMIRAKADADTVENGSLHDLANGLVAELIVENGTVCPEQFGAKGDDADLDTNAFINLLSYNYNNSNCIINLWQNRTYIIKNNLILPSNTIVIGNNATLKAVDGFDTTVNNSILTALNKKINIKNIVIDGNKSNVSTSLIGIYLEDCDSVFCNVLFKNCNYHQIVIKDGLFTGNNIEFLNLGSMPNMADVYITGENIPRTTWNNVTSIRNDDDKTSTGQLFYCNSGLNYINNVYTENVAYPFDQRHDEIHIENLYAKNSYQIVVGTSNPLDKQPAKIYINNAIYDGIHMSNVSYRGLIHISAATRFEANNIKFIQNVETADIWFYIYIRRTTSYVGEVWLENIEFISDNKPLQSAIGCDSLDNNVTFCNVKFDGVATSSNYFGLLYGECDFELKLIECTFRNIKSAVYDFNTKQVAYNVIFQKSRKVIGTTEERPSPTVYENIIYYDTTLAKHIMWNPSTKKWVNVDGTSL